jgi:hypothetical protein
VRPVANAGRRWFSADADRSDETRAADPVRPARQSAESPREQAEQRRSSAACSDFSSDGAVCRSWSGAVAGRSVDEASACRTLGPAAASSPPTTARPPSRSSRRRRLDQMSVTIGASNRSTRSVMWLRLPPAGRATAPRRRSDRHSATTVRQRASDTGSTERLIAQSSEANSACSCH